MLSIIKSFKYAFSGIFEAFKKERNFRIMVFLFFFSLFVIFYFRPFYIESLLLIFASVLMLSFELANSSVEKSLDLFTKHHNDNVRYIKDVLAGAVLLVSFLWLFVLILILKHELFF